MIRGHFLSQSKRIIFFVTLASVTLTSFQNCGPAFQLAENSKSLSSLGSELNVSCSLNGINYYPDDKVSGYPMSSVVFPRTCGNQVTRTCLSDGKFDGEVPLFPTCNQQCLHPDNGGAIDAGATYSYYSKDNGASAADCESAKVTSVCQATTGQFLPLPPVARFSTCKVAGTTCGYATGAGVAVPSGSSAGATVSGFQSQTATYPNLCGVAITLTCKDTGSWGGAVPLYTSCTQKCVHPDTNMPVNPGTTYSYYSRASGTQSECDAARVNLTCSATTGVFGNLPATRYASCAVQTVPANVLGVELYSQKCASCHGVYTASAFISKPPTLTQYNNALMNVSSMASLKGALTAEQVDSIINLFGGNSTGTPTTSQFACSNPANEKLNARNAVRLTGDELRQTYQFGLGSGIWNALSAYYYLIPSDGLNGNIETFSGQFTDETFENLSRFNEQVAIQVTSSNANIQSFIGTCASTTSFVKSCFDSFLSAKVPRLLRSPLSASDSATYWSAVTMGTGPVEQIKILVQLILNDVRFQFHIEQGDGSAVLADGTIPLSSYEIANRISYGMTGGAPDDLLWADAVANKLKMIANAQLHVDRLAGTQAFRNQVIGFFKFYSGTQSLPPLSSNIDFLQGISTAGLSTAIEADLNEFVGYTVFAENGNLKTLLTTQNVFPSSSALAQIYGTSQWVSGGAPQKAVNHVGLLSRAYFNVSSSENIPYIGRAKKLRGNFLCSPVAPPTVDSIALRPELTEADLINLTRRQFVDKATLSAPLCISCHSQMNDLSYLTGKYDTLGRYVTRERVYNPAGTKVAENTVVTAGVPNITSTDSRTFSDLVTLQNEFSVNDSFQRCMTRKAVQYFEKRPDNIVVDGCTLNKMDTKLKNGSSLKDFFLEKFKSSSILYKKVQ